MAENMRMEDLQAEVKKITEFMTYAEERFEQLDQLHSLIKSLAQSVDRLHQRLGHTTPSPTPSPTSVATGFNTSLFSTPFSSQQPQRQLQHSLLFQQPVSIDFGFQSSVAAPQPALVQNAQFNTQMAKVALVPFSVTDHDIQAIVDACKEEPGNSKYTFNQFLFSVAPKKYAFINSMEMVPMPPYNSGINDTQMRLVFDPGLLQGSSPCNTMISSSQSVSYLFICIFGSLVLLLYGLIKQLCPTDLDVLQHVGPDGLNCHEYCPCLPDLLCSLSTNLSSLVSLHILVFDPGTVSRAYYGVDIAVYYMVGWDGYMLYRPTSMIRIYRLAYALPIIYMIAFYCQPDHHIFNYIHALKRNCWAELLNVKYSRSGVVNCARPSCARRLFLTLASMCCSVVRMPFHSHCLGDSITNTKDLHGPHQLVDFNGDLIWITSFTATVRNMVIRLQQSHHYGFSFVECPLVAELNRLNCVDMGFPLLLEENSRGSCVWDLKFITLENVDNLSTLTIYHITLHHIPFFPSVYALRLDFFLGHLFFVPARYFQGLGYDQRKNSLVFVWLMGYTIPTYTMETLPHQHIRGITAKESVSSIVDSEAIPALLRHLKPPEPAGEGDGVPKPYEHELEKGCAFVLGLLTVKPEHQQLLVDAGALPSLMDLLKRDKAGDNSWALMGLIRRAVDAITNLAHKNSSIKTRVRMEGGIPHLVEFLEFDYATVQKAAAEALRTLAFKNDENNNWIVGYNALPGLVLILGSEDAAIHSEAGGVIGNLVHSSPNIKREVLLVDAILVACQDQLSNVDLEDKVHFNGGGIVMDPTRTEGPDIIEAHNQIAHMRKSTRMKKTTWKIREIEDAGDIYLGRQQREGCEKSVIGSLSLSLSLSEQTLCDFLSAFSFCYSGVTIFCLSFTCCIERLF